MLGIKTEVKMPNHRCKRSLNKAMSDVHDAKLSAKANVSSSYNKRLRSTEDDNESFSPLKKRRHLSETHRRSPRLSQQSAESRTPKARTSKMMQNKQTTCKQKTPSKRSKEVTSSELSSSSVDSCESLDETEESSGESPRKYTPVKRIVECTVNLTRMSDENPMPTKSFYGGSKTPYITPLQRKELAEKRASSTSKISMSSVSIGNQRKETMSERHRSKSVSGKSFGVLVDNSKRTLAKVKKSPNQQRNIILEAKSDVYKCSFGEQDSKVENDKLVIQKKNINNQTENQDGNTTPKKSKNRFFKHRSPGKKLQLALTRVGVSKNRFNMSFGASKVKKSDIIKSKKCIDKNSNLMKPYLNSKRKETLNDIFQPSSRVIRRDKNSVGMEKQSLDNVDDETLCNGVESGRISAMSEISDNYSVCSTGADSVLLLSEVESERGLSPDTTMHKNNTYNEDNDTVDTPQLEGVEKSEKELNISAEFLSQSSLNDDDYVAPTPCTTNTRLMEILHKKSVSSNDGVNKSLCENETTADTVNIQSILKSNKKLFPIFGPAAQSSPRPRSCPGTPLTSRHITRTPSNSPGVNSSKSSPKQVWKKVKDKDGKEQMMLDFGQKLQQVAPCPICGITYTRGDPNDETTHSKFHQKMLNVLKFTGWRKERVVQDMIDGGRILMVLPDDTQPMKKVNAVKQIVDQELGFVVESSMVKANSKTFLYVSLDRRIVGVCIAEVISQGYRVLSEDQVQKLMSKSPTKRVRPLCCSTQPEVAKCGINRIWVLHGERQKGIASKLVDCVRYNFILGNILKHSQLAFSDPTPDGQMFASKYCGTPSFLVYRKQL